MSRLNDTDLSQRNLLYRDHYRRVLKSIVVLSLVAGLLCLILIGIIITAPPSKYYATTTSGRVVPMHSLSEPVVTNDYLLQWASLVTRTAFNIDFVNYKLQLDKAKPDFTTDGWSKFIDSINQSGLLETVKSKKLEMNAIVSGTPVIVSTAVIGGRFTWRVQLPVLITFTSASATLKSNWVVTMNVQRISTLNAYKGIQVNDFVVRR